MGDSNVTHDLFSPCLSRSITNVDIAGLAAVLASWWPPPSSLAALALLIVTLLFNLHSKQHLNVLTWLVIGYYLIHFLILLSMGFPLVILDFGDAPLAYFSQGTFPTSRTPYFPNSVFYLLSPVFHYIEIDLSYWNCEKWQIVRWLPPRRQASWLRANWGQLNHY